MSNPALCPQCGSPQTQDFGLASCPSCGSMLVIDMDGNAVLAKDSVPEPVTQDAVYAETPSDENISVEAGSASLENELVTQESPEEQVSQSVEEADSSEVPENVEISDEFSNAEVQPDIDLEEPIAAPVFEASTQSPAEAFAEIKDFGNSDLKTGPLIYYFRIEGLDVGRDRDQLQAALSDPKLNFDLYELFQQIKNGRLDINSLNPAKAMILVKNLSNTKLRFTWRQDVFGV